MIRLLRSAPFVPMMFAAVFSLWGDEVDFGDLLGRPETRPSPARAGAATASERLEHASRRLQELQRQAEDSDASAGNPSAGEPDFLRKLRDYKIAVRKAQIRRINGQIAVARKAGSRDKSAYDRRKMTEFQTAFAQYTAKKKSWGYSGKDIDFADWIVRQLKSGKIDPDIQVEDSSYPQYSGPLLRCIMSGRIQKAPEIEKVLVDLGVDVSCLAKSDLPYRGIYAVSPSSR